MGLINIACPQCKQVHTWFSGNLDQRCRRCKYEAKIAEPSLERYNGEPLDGTTRYDNSEIWIKDRWHQIVPRRAVEGDIGDWNECQAYKFAHGAEWPNRCRVRVPAQYRWRRWEGPPANLQNLARTMTFGEWAKNIRMQKLMELARRRREQIEELRATIKTNEDFIKLLGDRLGKRLAQIDAIRRTCNVVSSVDP
jgi:hypothetical protein